MQRLKEINKREKTVVFLIFILLIGTLLTVKLANDNYKMSKIQNIYINNVVSEIKKVSNYKLEDFSNSIAKINKVYPVEVELTEKDNLIYSSLSSFSYSDQEIEKLDFLANVTVNAGKDREIWVGVHDNINYNSHFKNIFYIMLTYFAMFFIILVAIIINYKRQLLIIEENSVVTNVEVKDKNLLDKFTLKDDQPNETVSDKQESLVEEMVKDIVVVEEIEAVIESKSSVEEKVDALVEELIEQVDLEPISEVKEVTTKVETIDSEYGNFMNKYKYLGDE